MANRERVQFLVDALRSGEYQQTTGALIRQPSGEQRRYCCLGVACVVAAEHGLELKFTPTPMRYGITCFIVSDGTVADASANVLPELVREWYDFDSADPFISSPDYPDRDAASSHNDEEVPFLDIADMFEYTFLREDGNGQP